jgi:hypothetical protein
MSTPLADLSRLAIETGQSLSALLQRHAMEGLLGRLAVIREAEHRSSGAA